MDNGACAEDEDLVYGSGPAEQLGTKKGYYLTYGRGWANASNTPYRFYKHWSHEGGIASPLIAHWPAKIKDHGALRHEPAHLIDLMATCVDLGQGKYPSRYEGHAITPLEGKSLVPAFDNRSMGRAAIYWEHEGNRAVRMGRWKLVAAHKESWQLYDMQTDRTETVDLAEKRPELRDKMIAMYDAWAARCNVLPWRPARKPGFTPPTRVYPKTFDQLR